MVGLDARFSAITNFQDTGDDRALREKASEFEGMLIAQILQKLNECYRLDEDGMGDSANQSFQSLSTAAVGGGLARSGGLGIAEMIVRSLRSIGAEGTQVAGAKGD